MERRKTISSSAAYKEGDPDAVTAYYRIHFQPALARREDYETIIARLRASFTKEGILKSRAIEARLMNDSWSSPDYDLLFFPMKYLPDLAPGSQGARCCAGRCRGCGDCRG